MIEPGHEKLSLRRQAVFLGINRNRLAVRAHPARASWEEDQKALRELNRLHTRWQFYGQRKLLVEMRRAGVVINRKRLRRLMSEAGIAAVAPKRWTSQPQASHAKYPYLLRELKVEAADQVWCADICLGFASPYWLPAACYLRFALVPVHCRCANALVHRSGQ